MGERLDIIVSIEAESILELLQGPYVSRVFLHRDPDRPNVYSLHALVHEDPSAEALLRVISEYPEEALSDEEREIIPAPPEPTPAVKANMTLWRDYLDAL